jgi:hypothetical protein
MKKKAIDPVKALVVVVLLLLFQTNSYGGGGGKGKGTTWNPYQPQDNIPAPVQTIVAGLVALVTTPIILTILLTPILGKGVYVNDPGALDFSNTNLKASSPPANDFYMIFASDPQVGWTLQRDGAATPSQIATEKALLDSVDDPTSDDYHYAVSKIYNSRLGQLYLNFYNSITGRTGHAFQGVVINGDLTSFGWGGERDAFRDSYEAILGPYLFPGLGNHDYANNVNDCEWVTNGCASRMVSYAASYAKSVPLIKDLDFENFDNGGGNTYRGSLAYSWQIGDYYFIQLHNYSDYAPSWKSNDKVTQYQTNFQINSSSVGANPVAPVPWLANELKIAQQSGKKVIFNSHDSGDHWSFDKSSGMSGVVCGSAAQMPVAFAGHLHSTQGLYTSWNCNNGNSIPVYLSGAAIYGTFLWVRFRNAQGSQPSKISIWQLKLHQLDNADPNIAKQTHLDVIKNGSVVLTVDPNQLDAQFFGNSMLDSYATDI